MYVATSSEYNGTNQALGNVMLAMDYDPEDADYASEAEMLNSDHAVTTKPSDGVDFGIECEPVETTIRVKYVRSNSTTKDKRWYDHGTFQVATSGQTTGNIQLGQIWVAYDITFFKKQVVYGTLSSHILSGKILATTGITNLVHFGTSRTVTGNVIAATGTNAIYFVDQAVGAKLWITTEWVGSTATLNIPDTTVFNCNVTTLQTIAYSNDTGSYHRLIFRQPIEITASGAWIQYDPGSSVLPVNTTLMQLAIDQVNGDLF
jgi:hypothetical protein